MYLVPCVLGGGQFPAGCFATRLPPLLSIADSFKGLIPPLLSFFFLSFYFFYYICALSHAKNYMISEIQLTPVSDREGCLVPPSPFN